MRKLPSWLVTKKMETVPLREVNSSMRKSAMEQKWMRKQSHLPPGNAHTWWRWSRCTEHEITLTH